LAVDGFDPLPHLNTIKIWIRDVPHEADGSGPWSLGDVNQSLDIDPRLVLPVLAAVVRETNYQRQGLTRREARVITRIRESAPGIEPIQAWHLARELISADVSGNASKRDEIHAIVAGQMAETMPEATRPWPTGRPSTGPWNSTADVFTDGVSSGHYTGVISGTPVSLPNVTARPLIVADPGREEPHE
jgi:hypothetical protein